MRFPHNWLLTVYSPPSTGRSQQPGLTRAATDWVDGTMTKRSPLEDDFNEDDEDFVVDDFEEGFDDDAPDFDDDLSDEDLDDELDEDLDDDLDDDAVGNGESASSTSDSEDDDDDDDEDDVASPTEDDDDDEEVHPSDIEADLEEILRDRIAAGDDDEAEEEENVDTTETKSASTVAPPRSDEWTCAQCFLIVSVSQFGSRTNPVCPSGEDPCESIIKNFSG